MGNTLGSDEGDVEKEQAAFLESEGDRGFVRAERRGNGEGFPSREMRHTAPQRNVFQNTGGSEAVEKLMKEMMEGPGHLDDSALAAWICRANNIVEEKVRRVFLDVVCSLNYFAT